MSKKSKTASRQKRLMEKRKRKAAMRALYQQYALMGKNTKAKRKVRKLKDYNQGPRPRETPPGTEPQEMRLSTKRKTLDYWLKREEKLHNLH